MTDSDYNRDSPDVVLAFVTSQRQSSPWSVGITNAAMGQGMLVKPSWVRVDRLATVEQGLVRGVVGRLKPDVLATIRGKLSDLLG